MYDESLLLAGTPRADMRRAGLECGLRWSQPPGARTCTTCARHEISPRRAVRGAGSTVWSRGSTVCSRAEYGRRSEAGGDGAVVTGDGVPDSGRVDLGRGLRGRGVVLP